MKNLVALLCFLIYVSGIIISKGILSTIIAIFFPPWAWYLAVEKFLIYYQIIA